jgi:hypothetical protein
VIGLSARDALLVVPSALGATGDTLELMIPSPGKSAIEVTAGISKVETVGQELHVLVELMLVEQPVRRAINDLLGTLLGGDGGGARQHPRVVYDVPIRYGAGGRLPGRLEDLSQNGLAVRIEEQLEPGAPIEVLVPDYSGNRSLTLVGQVVQQRPAKEGGFHTGVALTLDPAVQTALTRLLADLLCR